MKKILYLVTQSDFGGAQRYTFDLASNLQGKYEVVVAGGVHGYQGELAKRLQAKNIRYIYISRLKRAISPLNDYLAFQQLINIIKQEKPDIIHLSSSKISILGALAARWCKIHKVIYTVHGWVFNEKLTWKDADYYLHLKPLSTFLERFTARFKNNIICLSEYDKQNAINNKITKTDKISVIYNGRENIKFLSRSEARQKLNINNDDFVIGSIGNLYKNKGHDYLIKAIKLLPATNQNIKVVIIGAGDEQNNLADVIASNKLANRITLAGSIPDAARLLPAFDLYVSSSLKEGLPYNILEAMQAGLPIVSTSVGAIPEVITDNKNGLLVEPKNVEALSDKIAKIINDKNNLQHLGVQAKQDVQKFSLEKMITETEKIYS